MTNEPCILALDQGTSSTKGVLFGADLRVLKVVTVPVDLDSPEPSWVQQDPEQIYQSVVEASRQLLSAGGVDISAVAISNQRESALAWDPETGKPLSAMLGWQDRRTAQRIGSFSEAQQAQIRAITGLPLDPMFSALKFAWILDQIDPDRSRSKAGKIALGTVDSWLVYRLTGKHVVEAGNASRTQLLSLETGTWSAELQELFNIPAAALPTVVSSGEQSVITTDGPLAGLTIKAVLADSHAALFAHSSTSTAKVKATFGTGSSVMALASTVAGADSGLVSTVAWSDDSGIVPAVEGNILSSGSTVVWLGGMLGKTAGELATLAAERQLAGISSGKVNLVPAFGGLGAPWWDVNATALLDGLTLSNDASDLAIAAFEAICLQIEDVLLAGESVTGQTYQSVSVDGGPTANAWLMQLMADLSQRTVQVGSIAELSAFGAALFAIRDEVSEMPAAWGPSASYRPSVDSNEAANRKQLWDAAVARSRHLPTKPNK